MGTITLTYHKDSAHGWIAVPKKIFNLIEFRGSNHSYHSDETVFLEHSTDFPVFKDLATKRGHKFELYEKHHGDDCFVRYLERLSL